MWKPPLFETLSLETRYELVELVRLPMFTIMTLAFPVAFYLMFGIGLSGSRATGGPRPPAWTRRIASAASARRRSRFRDANPSAT